MSKGKRLNTAEIAKIEVLRKIWFSNCHIARELGRSKGVIKNFIQKKYGIKKKTKGNTKLSEGQRVYKYNQKTMNISLFEAYVGILLLAGVYKSNQWPMIMFYNTWTYPHIMHIFYGHQ